ncbi:MAG: amidohydrolase [Burkholderiales bacterium]|nr:amidohydrolase [Burkholderiales bacterium]
MNAPVEPALIAHLEARAAALESQVIAWRRDLHAHPELGNQEVRTAGIVAAHLRALGLDEVREGVAVTGVVGLLKGALPGPCIALRADMDALPVTEEVDVPFASKARAQWNGEEVGTMHACGHDCHVAILMGVAQVLAQSRDLLAGSVKFIFQPAEEGLPGYAKGGARLMVEEAVLENPRPQAIFGLHVISALNAGKIGYRPGAMMASTDNFWIKVRGRQTHGAMPWLGADPVVASAQVVLGLQTLVSRQLDIMHEPAVVTVGMIHGGVRENIIPDEVELRGTFRTFDENQREMIRERIADTATNIACSCHMKAEVGTTRGYPVTVNDPKLTLWSLPTLTRVGGDDGVVHVPKTGGGEDFSYFQKEIPGVFYFIGITPRDKDPAQAPANHSPHFYVDESGLLLGLRLLLNLVADYAADPGKP